MNALLEGLKALGPWRLAAMAGVGAAVLGLIALLALRSPAERMALLYADLDAREAGQVVEHLERLHIPYQLGAGGTQVMVPAPDVARARVVLAKDGLPSAGSIGYEIFDRGDSFTASQFQQQLNTVRALEGELARTIRGIAGVRAARVHLVVPKREPFSRERQEAQASIVISTVGTVPPETVRAILQLMAGAVPGLKTQNIAVVDQRGTLLSRPSAGANGGLQDAEDLRRATEQQVARAVEEMLERGLGPGRAHVQAAVEMDFDQRRETEERYDPDGQVLRSQQSVNDAQKSTEAQQTTSVQNNLPNADAGREGAGSQQNRQEETNNYEIGKVVRTIVHDHPQISRISLAVLVDGVEETNPSGTRAWRARTPEELTQIGRLVRSAIGFNEKRGDQVEVVNMRFAAPADLPAEDAGALGRLGMERGDLVRLAQTGLLGAFALLVLLMVLRPMVSRLTAIGGTPALALEAAGVPGALAAVAEGPAHLAGPAAPTVTTPLLEASAPGQIQQAQLARLVETHPEATVSILRGWMQESR